MFFLLQKYVIQIKRRHSFHKYAANNILVEILLSNNVVDLMEKISCHYNTQFPISIYHKLLETQ